MSMRRPPLWLALALLIGVAAATPARAQNRRVVFEQSEYRFTSPGQRLVAKAGVLDATLRPASDQRIVWRVEQPAIASVSSLGVVQANRAGTTRLWAISGQDSAAAVLVVLPSGTIEFNPRVVRFEKAGERLRVTARVRSASGVVTELAMTDGPCRVRKGQVASLGGNGQVVARATGITYIQCTRGSVTDSVRIEVGQRPVTVLIANEQNTRMAVGDTMTIRVWSTNSAGEFIADASPRVASLNPAVIVVDSVTLLARAVGAGEATVIAQFGGISDSVRFSVPAPMLAGAARSDPTTPPVRDTSRPPTAVIPEAAPRPAPRVGPVADSAKAPVQLPAPERLGSKSVTVVATAEQARHSLQLAQGVDESRDGMLLGAEATVAPSRVFLIATGLRAGTLTGATGAGEVAMAEIDGQLTYWVTDWLGVRGGYTRRSQSTDLVVHQWQFVNATAETRFTALSGAFVASNAVSLLPWSTFSGSVEAPTKTSFALESGLEYRTNLFRAGLLYSLEQFAFPAVNGNARKDRFSSLRIRLGLHAGL